MKKLKNVLTCLMTLMFSVFSVFGLCSCGKTDDDDKTPVTPATPANAVVLDANIKTNIDTTVTYLLNNVYNKYPATEHEINNTIESAKEKFGENFKYYVKVASLTGFDDSNPVTTVKVGNQTFNAEQTTALSVGNDNFIVGKVWYVEDGDLYVTAAVMGFELVLNNTITVNTTTATITDIETLDYTNFTNVAYPSGTTNTCTRVGTTNEYNIVANEYKGLNLYFANPGEAVAALTKKVYDWTDPRYQDSIDYGLTGLATDTAVQFYPAPGYGCKMDYSVYLVGQGIARAKLNINVPAEDAAA